VTADESAPRDRSLPVRLEEYRMPPIEPRSISYRTKGEGPDIAYNCRDGRHAFHVLTSGHAKVPKPEDLAALGGNYIQHDGITSTGLQLFTRTCVGGGVAELSVRRHTPSTVQLVDDESGKRKSVAEHYVMRMQNGEGALMAYAVARAIATSVARDDPQAVTVTTYGDRKVTQGARFRKGSIRVQPTQSGGDYETLFNLRRQEMRSPASFCAPSAELPSSGPYGGEYFASMKRTPSEQRLHDSAKQDPDAWWRQEQEAMRRSYD